MGEKILTRNKVEELCLNKVPVITADMLDGYTRIEKHAFSGFRGLISVTIPNSVTSIGGWAFWDCIGLTSVTIGNSVTSIGEYAFSYCSSLTSVTLPNSVTSIENGAFDSCSGLTSVTVEAGNTVYDSRDNCNAIIETATNTLILGCQNTTIPNSVTSIGKIAFYGCSGLTSVTIPNSVTSIGMCAFRCCSGLTSVTIPDSVTSIDCSAFTHCRNLSSVEIPNSVKFIGLDAFCGCGFELQKRTDDKGRVIAYKGFNTDMICRGFRYKEGETYEIEDETILCERGFHACLNPLDCVTYYCGKVGKDVVFREVYLEGVSYEKGGDSKVVARKITIGREISLSEMADIASGRK